jgi:uncharacterized protein
MNCRPDCGACCTAPSISTPIPSTDGSPAQPKAANTPCPQLDANLRCRLFGLPQRPAVCQSLRPAPDMCGQNRSQAMLFLQRLEQATAPACMG